jgi:chromosome partitioning protein
MLLIPIQQDIFNYQSIKYQFGKLAELELDTLDIHMVFNQFDKPRTENRTVFSNQITDLFLEDTELKDFINPCFLSKSNIIKKYINNRDYHINGRLETEKQFSEIITLIKNLTGIIIKEEL